MTIYTLERFTDYESPHTLCVSEDLNLVLARTFEVFDYDSDFGIVKWVDGQREGLHCLFIFNPRTETYEKTSR